MPGLFIRLRLQSNVESIESCIEIDDFIQLKQGLIIQTGMLHGVVVDPDAIVASAHDRHGQGHNVFRSAA